MRQARGFLPPLQGLEIFGERNPGGARGLACPRLSSFGLTALRHERESAFISGSKSTSPLIPPHPKQRESSAGPGSRFARGVLRRRDCRSTPWHCVLTLNEHCERRGNR